ncbi:helicase C-terminal domain-containing protein [Candidatus Latescibacterota bacterium]
MKSPDTFISIDLETTGLDASLHEIIEIGAIKFENGEIVDEYSRLIKPDRAIPEFITSLTGISNDDVKRSETIGEVIPSLLRFIKGSSLMGHNVRFDVGFLRKAAGLGNIESAIDNIELARIVLPTLPSYSLDSLIEFFALTPENRHRALDDAKITAVVFLKMIDMLRIIPDSKFNDLHRVVSKSGSLLGDVFDSMIQERLEELEPPKARQEKDGHTFNEDIADNLFGDFREDQGFREPDPKPIDSAIIESHLKNGGALSECHETYEERPGQIMMAKRIAQSFNESEILLVEAGTGTGKSIAYLLPSILWAENSRERVVISTNTKNLQEQLFAKDIPLMSMILDFPFRAVILKGRGNYICRNRWIHLAENPGRILSKEARSLLTPVAAWLQKTKSGDLSETGFFHLLGEYDLLEHINSDSSSCRGIRCTERDACFVNRIRRAALRSHVVIVNHSLVFSDMMSDGGVLGPYNRLIFDEAHNIEKTALRFLGVSFSYYRVRRILNRLLTREKTSGILAVLIDWIDEMVKGWPEYNAHQSTIEAAADAVASIRIQTGNLFSGLDSAVRQALTPDGTGHSGKLRYSDETDIFSQCADHITTWTTTIVELIGKLNNLSTFISGVSPQHIRNQEDILSDIEEVRDDVIALSNDLAFLADAGGRNVFWFEYSENDSPMMLRIHSAPLDIDEKLAKGIYDVMETVVMTSATLAVARDFTYISERLGVELDGRERTTNFIAASPFDLAHQSALIIPSYLPTPKQENFIEESNRLILRIVSDVRRGMLVLFTSWGHLNRTYHDLKDTFAQSGISLLAQGIDGSRSLLLRRFREEPKSVLLGTDSFWEGVDVPGHALEIVVISRLPFAVPSDPIIEAQMEEIERAGGSPFIEFSVPEAAIKLRQGAGRLIRHRNDKGVIIILDKRVVTTRYGSLFKRSLPGSTLRADYEDMVVEGIQRWFEE